MPGEGPRAAALVALCCLATLIGTGASAEARSGEITVAASGDVLSHGPVIRRARDSRNPSGYNFRPFFRNIKGYIRSADLALCHQEIVVGPGKPLAFPTFRVPFQFARTLERTGYDACSSASNHSYDHGAAGIASTISALDRAGIEHAGTYPDAEAARRGAMIEVRGHRIALLSYAEFLNKSGAEAPPWQPTMIDPATIAADATAARERGADAVIVNLHWGHDYEPRPGAKRFQLARSLAAVDAISAIVGQGPHLAWPIRFFDGKPVVFSSGNLLSKPRDERSETRNGLIAKIHFQAGPSGALRASRVSYAPILDRPRDLRILTAGRTSGHSRKLRREMRHVYRKVVSAVGRGAHLQPVPKRLSR